MASCKVLLLKRPSLARYLRVVVVTVERRVPLLALQHTVVCGRRAAQPAVRAQGALEVFSKLQEQITEGVRWTVLQRASLPLTPSKHSLTLGRGDRRR